jgi:hypothetical protein
MWGEIPKLLFWWYNYTVLHNAVFNNFSPKAKWLPVNIHRDEVEVNIRRNHWAW